MIRIGFTSYKKYIYSSFILNVFRRIEILLSEDRKNLRILNKNHMILFDY
jgi:hypothetical protein